MLAVYASALAILLGSLVLGTALLELLGHRRPTWLSGAVGFAALTVASPLLIRLPGRGTTLTILLGIAFLAAIAYLSGLLPLARRRAPAWTRRGGAPSAARRTRRPPPAPHTWIAPLVVVIVLAVASLPFAFNERNGVLGEGIYTNDQAAQLYWTDWLQHGVGPEPNPVRFGYPTGPQAVAVAASEVGKASLGDGFNGLLLAIPALAALAALAALESLPPARRVAAACLTGLPYLAASFLAQSAFKETAMALLVLSSAVALGSISRASRDRDYAAAAPRRAMIVALIAFAAASVFVYSLPGLVWLALGIPIWLALELITGGMSIDLRAARATLGRHRVAVIAVAAAVIAIAALSIVQLSGFVGRIGDVQASAGRLSSPVFPGEALGIWPEGDFRVVRGDVDGAYLALALGLVAAAIGAVAAIRRRDWSLVAMGASAVLVYAWARPFASIYVESKALAILSPLVVLAALSALFAPVTAADSGEGTPVGDRRTSALEPVRLAFGVVVAIAFAASTFLALRAAPVGFDRGTDLESLAGLIQGRDVAFLGVDRFAGYWLRGTLMRSPGGYVPSEVRARPKKVWQQGLAMDFDTLSSGRLDDFNYVITTTAAYQSTPPPNFEPVTRTDSYELWKRTGPTPPLGVIDKDGAPGRVLDCSTSAGRRISRGAGTATVLPRPVVQPLDAWSRTSPFDAPGTATQRLALRRGRWALSLQYHSQVPLTVTAPGLRVTLPASLEGMYLTRQAQGAFWPAGELRQRHPGAVTVTVSAAKPSAFQRLMGVRRQAWLGPLAATRPGATKVPLARACGRYVDHFTAR